MERADRARPRLGLVVPFLTPHGGGIESTAQFLRQCVEQSGRFELRIASLAYSADDRASVLLREPSTWAGGVRVRSEVWRGHPVEHFGAFLAEFEFQRYRPRAALTRFLRECDVIQVIAGSPSWARVALGVGRPVAVQVAAFASDERRRTLDDSSGPRATWRRWMARVTARLDRSALDEADAVFALTEEMVARVRRRVEPSRVVLAPQGVDTQRFRPRSEEPGAAYILSVARFADPRKRVSVLFEAYHRLRERRADAPDLVLAGSSAPSDRDWELAQSLGIRTHIRFHLRLETDKLAALYRNAAMFVLTSDQEGLGISILEAMASGIPVVSTDCGGPRTSVIEGETGFLAPCGDAAGLARRMEQLIAAPALASRLGEAGFRRALERFSNEAAGRAYLATYDRLLAGKAPAG
ncbi:MAG: glycosyltransferase family 4 protein [bacterium]|nr:glycosyltransferase family 4 protein [bacterium]